MALDGVCLVALDLTDAKNRQCTRKQKYLDAVEAKAKAKVLHKLYKKHFNYYECPYCKHWHVGSQRSKEAAKRRTEKGKVVRGCR